MKQSLHPSTTLDEWSFKKGSVISFRKKRFAGPLSPKAYKPFQRGYLDSNQGPPDYDSGALPLSYTLKKNPGEGKARVDA